MTTTLEKPGPPPATPAPMRFPSVYANLIPDEVIASRKARRMRQRVLFGLAGLLVLLIAWYGLSMMQTSGARSRLSTANATADKLQHDQQQFATLVTAQQRAATITSQLQQLMAGDVQWADLLASLRAAAPSGVTIGTVSATLTAPAGGGSGAPAMNTFNTTGKKVVGTLSLSGNAPDKAGVAALTDALAKVKGLAVPFPASVGGDTGAVTYSLQAMLTTDVMGGRYAAPASGGH